MSNQWRLTCHTATSIMLRLIAGAAILLALAGHVAAQVTPRSAQGRLRVRDLGLKIGVYQRGPLNAMTDVAGVRVGQVTLVEGNDIRTGVTAILPHHGNMFQDRVENSTG
jgi:D-aminopeptidase